MYFRSGKLDLKTFSRFQDQSIAAQSIAFARARMIGLVMYMHTQTKKALKMKVANNEISMA